MNQAITMHGWAGDASNWRHWREELMAAGWHWSDGERGYGDLPPSISALASGARPPAADRPFARSAPAERLRDRNGDRRGAAGQFRTLRAERARWTRHQSRAGRDGIGPWQQ